MIGDPTLYGALKEALADTDTVAAAGREALVEAAAAPTDFVMAGIVGAAGLRPTLAAAAQGAVIGLANKECLVCAGSLMLAEVERGGATLLPVDSEHNAIYQVFDFERADSVEKIVLTASGGPFREALGGDHERRPRPSRRWPTPTGTWAPRFRWIPRP